MVVLSKVRQMLLRTVFGSSLAGDGMLVRLRSTSIALLSLTTAIGLGLIAFISQIGWPGIVNSPIPGSPARAGSVHNAIALTRGPVASTAPRPTGRLAAVVPSVGRAVTPTAGSGRGSSRQVDVASVGQQPAAVAQPQPVPAPVPTRSVEPQTTSSAPLPAPAPITAVAETPQSSVAAPSEDPKPVKSTSGSKPTGPTTTKVDGNGEGSKPDEGEGKPDEVGNKPGAGEEGKPETPSPGPKHGEDGKGKEQPIPSKPADHRSGKPDASGGSAPVFVAPPSTPPAKIAPEVGAFGSGKGAWDAGKPDDWDAGKSDERHH